MANYVLSKSTFIRSVQCLKSLYLNKFYPTTRDPLPPERAAIFKRGHKVGDLARNLFPGGIDVSPKKRFDFDSSVKQTLENIKSGTQSIYEATFVAEEILIMLDILLCEDDKLYAFEVKSSLRISDTFIRDASLQYYVMSKAGFKPESFSIIHLNSQYHRKGDIDLGDLFSIVDVTQLCVDQQEQIAHQLLRAKSTLSAGKIPNIRTGEHCFNPYTCDFTIHCQARRIDKQKPLEQVKYDRSSAFLSAIYIRPAIPLFENSRPYEALPMVWTIYDGSDFHQQFFNLSEDPRDKFTTAVQALEKSHGSIVTDDSFLLSSFTEMELVQFHPDYNALSYEGKSAAMLSYEELGTMDDIFQQFELQEGLKSHSMKVVEQMLMHREREL